MIKIIKQGNPNYKVKVIYTHKCPNCHCVFEFEKDDCEENYHYIYKHGEIECPCCKSHLGIFFNELEKREVEE